MRFSGHETFPLRYAWVPKAHRALTADPAVLSQPEDAMVVLGVGKNMVTAIRFWMLAAGFARPDAGAGCTPTEFGALVLSEDGRDPYLEDVRTLWLIHWRLCQNVEDPLFAWDHMLNRWHLPEISRSEALPVLAREAERWSGRPLSPVTLAQHFDVFVHTYVPTRSRKGEVLEDNLDSPLVELELIREIGERRVGDSSRREPVYGFRREPKPEITPGLFAYLVHDFWTRRHAGEMTLGFREIAVGHGGPGQVLKLPEEDLRNRLESLGIDSGGRFSYRESGAVPHVTREIPPGQPEWDEPLLLDMVYGHARGGVIRV